MKEKIATNTLKDKRKIETNNTNGKKKIKPKMYERFLQICYIILLNN